MEKTKVGGSYNPFSPERKDREMCSRSGATYKDFPHWTKFDDGGRWRIRDERPPSQIMTEGAYGGIRKPADKCVSDGVTPRNPFVAEKRRLTWSDDVRDGTSTPSRQLIQPSAASYEVGAGSQTTTFQRGYELPLTPISAEKFVLDAASMTVGANKGARSKHCTTTLQAQSDDVFDIPIRIRRNPPTCIKAEAETIRHSASGSEGVPKQASPYTLPTPDRAPLSRFAERIDAINVKVAGHDYHEHPP
jgi:hypothetical protein